MVKIKLMEHIMPKGDGGWIYKSFLLKKGCGKYMGDRFIIRLKLCHHFPDPCPEVLLGSW